MCHESSGVGPRRDDRRRQGHGQRSRTSSTPTLIFVIGQNPGTNHPRMLTDARRRRRGAARAIVSDQPAARARARALHAPAGAARACCGGGTALAELLLQVRVGGDVALLKGIDEGAARARGASARATCSTATFLARAHDGLRGASRRRSTRVPWDDARARRAASRAREMRELAELYAGARAHDRVLGDGPHAAPHGVAQRAGGREPAAAARQHRPARRGPVPGARPQQRAGRPHDGHLRAADAPRSSTRSAREFGVRAAARRTASTPSRRSARWRDGDARASSSRSAATSPSPRPTPRSRRRRSSAAR